MTCQHLPLPCPALKRLLCGSSLHGCSLAPGAIVCKWQWQSGRQRNASLAWDIHHWDFRELHKESSKRERFLQIQLNSKFTLSPNIALKSLDVLDCLYTIYTTSPLLTNNKLNDWSSKTCWRRKNKAIEIQTFLTINSGDELTKPQVTVSNTSIQLACSHQLIYLTNSKSTVYTLAVSFI